MFQIGEQKFDAIFAGDLNAKSVLWGSPYSDERGRYIEDWAAALDLVIINKGKTPTFERGWSKSYIDVTGATTKMAKRIRGWEVLTGEVLTYHHHIIFEINIGKINGNKVKCAKSMFDKAKYSERINEVNWGGKVDNAEDLTRLLSETTKECTIVVRGDQKQMPFWWNVDIEAQRRACFRWRRKISHFKKRKNFNNAVYARKWESLQVEYKSARKELKKLIRKSKREHWSEMVNDLDKDVWGTGYKVIVKRIGVQTLPFNLTTTQRAEIIRQLFLSEEDVWQKGSKVREGIPPFNLEELGKAAEQIKAGKAPGADRIPPEAVKMAVHKIPELFLRVLNQLLKDQEFPKPWKIATVTLIWKGKDIEQPSAFRPICMISVIGKFLECLIKNRLEKEIEVGGGLSERQHGFRKGFSTVGAINAIVDAARSTTNKWFIVIALDIKNAFNSVPWSGIIEELHRRDISLYLINLVESYFQERQIQISKSENIKMTGGVPQGSVLGPLLWNIFYDRVLEIRLTEGATSIAYADDLAVMVEATDEEELEYRVNESMREIGRWMKRNGLTLAAEKTEAIALRGPRKKDHLNLQILDQKINLKKTLNYLGVTLDEKLSFGEHVKQVTEKAERKMAALARILPNIGGPRGTRRRVLGGVIHSIILYGAPVWQGVTAIQKYENMLISSQRKAILRIVCGYKTVSSAAAQVIAGIPPVTLLARERSRLYHKDDAHLEIVKKQERETTINEWQEMWSNHTATAQWTKRLIPNLVPWVNCNHRNPDYYLTQFLSGHGSFKEYTKKMGITPDDRCMYCSEIDTAEHTILKCDRWVCERKELENNLGTQIVTENLAELLIVNKRNWEDISEFIRKTMRQKKRDEREVTQM